MMTPSVLDLQHDVGPGWRPLLREMHRELDGQGIAYEALQVKEKWGRLRVYIKVEGESHVTFDLIVPGRGMVTGTAEEGSPAWQQAMAVVRAAEEKSAVICEDCGGAGRLRKQRRWLRTLCDPCDREQETGDGT